MDDRPIGIFDSGAGGLTVLHECLVTLPAEDFVYLGDGARCPYGPRSADEVQTFALELGTYLERQGVKLIAAACNTATAVALPLLQEQLTVPVVGVLTPGGPRRRAGDAQPPHRRPRHRGNRRERPLRRRHPLPRRGRDGRPRSPARASCR